MKTLKCKNCGGLIEWRRGDGQVEDEEFIIGCPSCRQNIVYGRNEINKWIVEADDIHQPKHYTYGEIEVIDFIEQVAADYDPKEAVHVANVIKYLARASHKGTKDQDIDKMLNYAHRLATGEWKE